ncbi:Transcription factor LHW like [Actinidia chinensis var. chinensis]|uniref:Transcription factor LHW like n=1 Tax=Actinidia chinensis var. chinensis TaxID=1590841 RepID=A0A2R6Q797_ACTCC|nr:Transcription factor LHW like [Actinidia chinensis var. chinensis]
MGYLLKEALKTLCCVNRWSYAVFWKIGSQNPKLLIWEDCYYEPMLYSMLKQDSTIDSFEKTLKEWEGCRFKAELRTPQVGVRAEDQVTSLMNRMMLDNRVKVVGQGLVGRAAFTGNHLWILSENCAKETHPPEVQNEVYQQFSAGIRTLAVIPILAHGVVQLGSSFDIMENMAFVNDVKSVILQLGCVPGVLLSDCYTSKEPAPRIGVPIFFKSSVSADPSGVYKVKDSVPSVGDKCNQQSMPSQAIELVGQPSHSSIRHKQNNLQGNVGKSQYSLCLPNNIPVMMPSFPFSSQLENEETEAEIIPLNPERWLNQQASLYNHSSGSNEQLCVGPTPANYSNLRIMGEQMLSDAALHEDFNGGLSTSGGILMSQLRTNGALSSSAQLNSGASTHPKSLLNSCSLPAVHRSASIDISCTHLTGSGLNAGSSKTETSTSDPTDHLMSNPLLLGSSDFSHSKNDKCSQIEVAQRRERIENDLFQALNIPLVHLDEPMNLSDDMSCLEHNSHRHDYGNQSPRSEYAQNEDKGVQPSSGDDLFDIFGVDFKNKLFDGSWNNFLNDGPDASTKTLNKSNFTSSNLQDGDSELYSGIACTAGNDHLLDAVVNRVHTAAKQNSDDSVSCRTTLTSCSARNASPSYGRVNVADQMQGVLSGLPKSLAKLAAAGSYSFKSECSKKDAGNYSHTSSICGSQISSWEQGHSMKHSNCASTAYSKRPDDVSKSNRKRLKPGENPRPRPKDRQMIQDRMKELREIVPNGAKCSIDALLERTIKHMLFLQSVTKHSDKLKQTGDSKIINKDGGLLLKNNIEGGRTWAYEVGSQSMVCPIIVEDLNPIIVQDLNPPRQMLVEMLCEERGLFLEIADIIRGLGLTILKGVMETRNDKIWAQFAVEANRDVTRMEIFVSLVHLLEQTVKSNAAAGNGIESDNRMIHQSFHQSASIPATGRPM